MKHEMQRLSVIGLALALALIGLYLLLTPVVTASQSPTVAAHPLVDINACGTITSTTTWTPNNLYVADNCDIIVSAGVTLTLQAGTAVKFGGAASALIVQGSLVAQGTEGDLVAITSLHDNAHGDTAPGSTGAPAAGDWYGIHFAEGSAGNIEHAFIGYAGSGGWNGTVGSWNKAQVRVMNASLTMQHTTVDSGLRVGIYLEGTGITPVIEDVHVADNNDPAWNKPGYAIYQFTINMQPTYSDLTFSNNDVDAVVIYWAHEPMQQDVTLGGTVFSSRGSYVIIPSGRTLTVAPGTQLSFLGYSLIAEAGATLLAEGTPTQPVTFTSILTAPLAGDWQGIVINPGGTARLAHCDVSYGGADSHGGLDLHSSDVEVSDCHIHHHQYDGVWVNYRDIAPSFTNVHVTDNGRYGIKMGGGSDSFGTQPEFTGGSIQRNAQGGVAMDNTNSGHRPTFRDVEINDNGADGILVNSLGAAPLLENISFTGNTGAAVRWWAGQSPTFRNLSASGNGMDALVNTGGDIWGGSYWAVAEAGLPVYLVGNTNIQDGALLSIEPGTTLILTPTVYIKNIEGGSLYALGTPEQPITFTGVTQTPGDWGYIESTGTLFLNHCTIEYGGAYTSYGMINIWGSEIYASGPKVVQNCRIRHSLMAGLKMSWGDSPLVRNNEIYSNTTYGVLNTEGSTLDARYTWWGDPSGPYHPTQNPDGKGNAVGYGDNVVFTPWLTAPPTQTVSLGEMIVDTGAPALVSPGQTVDYAIQYLNGMAQTVESAVLMMQLPHAAEYVDSSHGGIYWPERDQVFWKLGDLAPNARGLVSVRLRFYWGLPSDYTDGTITLLAGSNYNADSIDVEKYNNYAPAVITGSADLSQTEFDALRAAHPDLETLYQQALTQGYEYVKAYRATFDDSDVATSAVMVTSDQVYVRVLSQNDSHSLAMTVGGNLWALQDTTGGVTVTVNTMQSEYWGNWLPEAAVASVNSPTGCTEGMCNVHCVGKEVTYKVVVGMAKAFVGWATWGFSALIDPPSPPLVMEVKKIVTDCYDKCEENPLNGCCDADGQVRWSPGRISGFCGKEYCNPNSGTYGWPGQIPCAYGTRCVSGFGDQGGCKACQPSGALYQEIKVVSPQISSSTCASSDAGNGDCADLGLLVGMDPNAKYGPVGDLLPGQLVTYTITYENVGEGRVYGVYVTDQLADVFDADTLQIQAGGVYLPYDRTLVWMVGELGPHGDPDSQGVMSFTVRLRDDLPSGTVVRNEAIVFFPSVPEETPTNSVVNLIQPLVAVPQDVETNYHQPVTITLEGRSVGALPLTFRLDEPPLVGSLTGTLPELVYTPPENFVSVDGFSFVVSNGITESRPAYVRIVVSSVGDTTPPEVVWTNPADGASDVVESADPIYTDLLGPVYPPVIAIGFSEALSATTVTTQTVHLESAAGVTQASVDFDGLFNLVTLAPRAPLLGDTVYTVTVMSGIADLADNLLGVEYRWHFSTSAPAHSDIYLPLVLRNN